MYRHSLFVPTSERADQVKQQVNDLVAGVEDSYLSNDGESRNIEVRFFTEEKLSERDQHYIVRATVPLTYELNCE